MYEPNDERQGEAQRERVISPTLIGLLVVAVLAIVFIVQNTEENEITFLFWEVTTSVWVAIALALGLGMVLGQLLAALRRRGRRRAGRDDRR